MSTRKTRQKTTRRDRRKAKQSEFQRDGRQKMGKFYAHGAGVGSVTHLTNVKESGKQIHIEKEPLWNATLTQKIKGLENVVAPDFINEKGVKWWLDNVSTGYARSKGLKVQVWSVEEPTGEKTRLITSNGETIYENQSIENIGIHIDLLAVLDDFDEVVEKD